MKKEKKQSKMKKFIAGPFVLTFAVLMVCFAATAYASENPEIMHPMMKPAKVTDKAKCDNCGMNRNMWARTRHEFKNTEGMHYTCSLHCLADMSAKSASQPGDVSVALYKDPEKVVMASDAFYVVGSKAKGTMTMNSKIAFNNKKAADEFAGSYGGSVVDFNGAFTTATKELTMARNKIAAKRMKTGKIKMPTEKEQCAVCGMYPARFPKYKSQIFTMDKKNLHFCSSSCLVKYQSSPDSYIKPAPAAMMTWVTVYDEDQFDYAGGLYYVVGSSLMGSMGPEAIPFREQKKAKAFADKNGGEVLLYKELTPEKIGGKMH